MYCTVHASKGKQRKENEGRTFFHSPFPKRPHPFLASFLEKERTRTKKAMAHLMNRPSHLHRPPLPAPTAASQLFFPFLPLRPRPGHLFLGPWQPQGHLKQRHRVSHPCTPGAKRGLFAFQVICCCSRIIPFSLLAARPRRWCWWLLGKGVAFLELKGGEVHRERKGEYCPINNRSRWRRKNGDGGVLNLYNKASRKVVHGMDKGPCRDFCLFRLPDKTLSLKLYYSRRKEGCF